MAEWIDVKERLPESAKIVLVSALNKWEVRETLLAAHISPKEINTEVYGWHDYEGDTIYDEENDCFWIPECWYESNAILDNENYVLDDEYTVTHWMPLPEPPEQKNDFKE